MSCISDERQYSSSVKPSLNKENFLQPCPDGPSVWVGFIEDIPVIGTVKEGVELVLAVHEGNESVVRQKEEAIIKSLCAPPQESLLEPMKKLDIPETPKSAGASGHWESSGLQDIREVRLEFIAEYVITNKKGQQTKQTKQTKQTNSEKTQMKQEVEKKIRCIIAYEYTPAKKDKASERSKRGEHVFNYGILKFHKKLLDDFLKEKKKSFKKKEDYNRLGCHSLIDDTATIIEKTTVFFDEDEVYINSNAVVYGIYCRELRSALFGRLDPNKNTDNAGSRVKEITYYMNKEEVYVDHYAKEKWFMDDGRNKETFKTVKKEVKEMYEDKRGVRWCDEIKTLLK
ncbi:uncharacterized protein LOC118241593 [Electrophorus electricus]|uniref:uncharacterized protein LOC118241593 n=1 Tax=Electrophorus electricus TaxID=8005 RepID=UPI0015D09ED9|nr:uncharacterized protein LOC118241593 [Electrophorus electricus]